MFKKMRSVNVPVRRQGFIYYACMNYDALPSGLKSKVDECIKEVIGSHKRLSDQAYEKALREYLTRDVPLFAVATRHYVRESMLISLRREFYQRFHAKVLETPQEED